jgi:hypothetical protein
MSLTAMTDRYVQALAEGGTPTERIAAKDELVKRGLAYTKAQEADARKPRPHRRSPSGSWGWGGTSSAGRG